MQLKPWLRLVRLRFLLASVIAVSAGIAVSWNEGAVLNLYNAALTMLGVVLLHASVDVLNDYWDFKRGIDTKTKRTPFSGGTGVLPEKILQAKDVRIVGLGLLVAGASIGAYFVATSGLIIAVLLGFAIVSIYFYSTRIVDSGLAEVFGMLCSNKRNYDCCKSSSTAIVSPDPTKYAPIDAPATSNPSPTMRTSLACSIFSGSTPVPPLNGVRFVFVSIPRLKSQ